MAAATDELDLTVLLLTHDALRRDLARLQDAAPRAGSSPTGAGLSDYWALVRSHLEHHHTMEDRYVWPVLRDRVDAAGAAVLDEMEAEHAVLDPLLERVSAAVTPSAPGAVDPSGALAALSGALTAHLAHEERDAIPLMQAHFTAADQRTLSNEARRSVGLRGVARFFPWLLDDADPALAGRLLAQLPPPLRLLVKGPWRRSHARRVAAMQA